MDENNKNGNMPIDNTPKPTDNSVKPENDAKAAELMGFDGKNPPVQSEFNPETHWKSNLIGTVRERQPDVAEKKPIGQTTADNRIKELIKAGELRGSGVSEKELPALRGLLKRGYTWEHLKDAQEKIGYKNMAQTIRGLYDEINSHQQQNININDAISSLSDIKKEYTPVPYNDALKENVDKFVATSDLVGLKNLGNEIIDKLKKGETKFDKKYNFELNEAKRQFKKAYPNKDFTPKALLSMLERAQNVDEDELFKQ